MPTFVKQVQNQQIIIQVEIHTLDRPDDKHRFDALVDTGAEGTVVSSRVVTALSPMAIDTGRVILADHTEVESPIFLLNVAVPVAKLPGISDQNASGPGETGVGGTVMVMTLPRQPDNYDVLLGMDLLPLFHITLVGGQFLMSV